MHQDVDFRDSFRLFLKAKFWLWYVVVVGVHDGNHRVCLLVLVILIKKSLQDLLANYGGASNSLGHQSACSLQPAADISQAA